MDPFALYIDESDIKTQRRKARELRATQWWKRRIAKGVCYYCSGSFSSKDLTMDHIVPVARGGKSTKGNVEITNETVDLYRYFDATKLAEFFYE